MNGELTAWIRQGLTASVRGFWIGVLFYVCGVVLLVLSIISISFLALFGAGLFLVPLIMVPVRALANERRKLAGQWSGVEIPAPYKPRPPMAPFGLVGAWQRCRWLLGDPATWRDLLWLLCSPLTLALGILPAAVVGYGIEGILVMPTVLQFVDGYHYGPGWLIDIPLEGIAAIPQGMLVLALGLAIAPALLRLHDRFTKQLLGPTRQAALDQRVRVLTRTRAETVDAQAAELRRIERDLHDGAQARLVALGMSLGLAEDLVTRDPIAAQKLLAEARDASERALSELRDLVRGIHPPVLAERGLDGAVRALALTLPIPVEVDVELGGRPQAPVESAAYFAIAEALANVVKHSHATRAWVLVRHDGRGLGMTVSDDGVGGADPAGGTGLRGMERRLAAFDGTVVVSSPPGGPTVVTMELPCELSSPKTLPSSGTG
ncbi:sensor histidine kinase [Phytohabitans sp. ZYX-F-186]|uniref:histidine kinase n=1 Tax=Phytohabitans maris TaxID=3071409 RepID=A0ABU0Z9K5_9ACTN|nr:sensor histidine kinase [Phytohabitans sp. ZYX-F-186]MDQ7903005.1 sensor histidine kinase [Phytohabitans sp. ZYX-F-186]